MTVRYLLDTNICIYIQRERPPAVLEKFRSLRRGEVAISIITLGELYFGAFKSQHRQHALDAIEELSTLIPALELPLAAGRHYGEIRTQLNAQGQPIGGNDLWIAAHALAADLILVSNNTREFERVPQLKLENWTLN